MNSFISDYLVATLFCFMENKSQSFLYLITGLGDEPSPSPTPSAPPHSAPLAHSASWECLSTLPTNGSPLRHVTHVRPRPPRRHRAGHLPPESVSSSQTARRTVTCDLIMSLGRQESPSSLELLCDGKLCRRIFASINKWIGIVC